MAEGLVARRLASLLSKSIRYYERCSDAGGGVFNEGLHSGRGILETRQCFFTKSDVYSEKRSSLEHIPRIFTEGLESQKFAYFNEYARRQGTVIMIFSIVIVDKFFFFQSQISLVILKN